MKYFEISVISHGKKGLHYLKAANKMEALNIARANMTGMVLRVKEVPLPLSVRVEELKERISKAMGGKEVDLQKFVVFVRQVSVMINAGISLRDALSEGVDATDDKRIRMIAAKAMEDIEAGLSFSDSLKQYEREVGSITVAMVELGEKTGALAESLDSLATMLEEVKTNRTKMKKAMRMPIMSLAAMAIAFVVLIVLVVPKFKKVFAKFGADLPLPTQILLMAEHALSNYGLFILAGLAGLAFAHGFARRKNHGYRFKTDKYMLRIYLIGTIQNLAMLGRFMMVFGELVRAGVPLTEALNTASGTIENLYLKEKLEEVNVNIARGNSLAAALDESKLFESMSIQMVKSGESGGELDQMLRKVADYYKMRFQNIIDNIATYIEPMLMLVVAGMVLMLALGIFMPMWDIASAAKR